MLVQFQEHPEVMVNQENEVCQASQDQPVPEAPLVFQALVGSQVNAEELDPQGLRVNADPRDLLVALAPMV